MSNFPTGDRSVLTWSDVYRVARQAGFSPADAIIATAITQPESGRQPGVQQSGQPYRTTGWGLWQITPGNSVPNVGVDNALLDPLTNAKAAYAKFTAAGGSFRPWTTYADGAFRPFLGDAQQAAAAVGGAIGGAVGDPESGGADTAASGAGGSDSNQLGGVVPTNILQSIQDFLGSGAGGVNPNSKNNADIAGAIQLGTIFGQDVGNALDTPQRVGLSVVSGVVDWLSSLVSGLGALVTGLLWLTQPYNWVRLIAGAIGGVFVLGGAFLVATSG